MPISNIIVYNVVCCVKLMLTPCVGMVEVLKLMQGGFPCRAHLNDLYQKYKAMHITR